MNNEGFTLLLVDDQASNLEVLSSYLGNLGFDLMVATDGLACLERATAFLPDLILLDIQMPGIDGFETCRRLKFNPLTRDIPVLFLSAISDTPEKVEGFRAGAVDYITKPIQYEELLARISTQLHIMELTRSLKQANEDLEKRVALRTTELNRSNRDIIFALAKALQLRDHESSDHCERVSYWTVRFCRELGFSQDRLVNIARGALLHDIGKIGIPDAILLKTGKLNPEEWLVMQTHPAQARQIIASIPSLVPAIDIPWNHHENWDGDGYPRGLKSLEIPEFVRIFTIVDFWDASSTDRTYRPAMTPPQTQQCLYEARRAKLDPTLLDRYLPVLESVNFNPSHFEASEMQETFNQM